MKKHFSSFISHLSSRKGFTLIELLVVVAVIGILAGGILFAINPADQIKKARDAKRKSDLSQIQKAVEAYYNDFGRYPATDETSTPKYEIKPASGTVAWGSTGWQYMGTLPQDPSSSKNYAYCSPTASAGQAYYLYASLDKDGNNPSNFSSAGCPATSCGTGTTCNYGVSSPNVSP